MNPVAGPVAERLGNLSRPGIENGIDALGLGIQFAKWGGLDVAFKYDAFPELRNEFGESTTIQVLLNLRF